MNAPAVVRFVVDEGAGEKHLPNGSGSEVGSLPYELQYLAALAERERAELEAPCKCGHERGDHLHASPHGCERPCIEACDGSDVAYVGSLCACVEFRARAVES